MRYNKQNTRCHGVLRLSLKTVQNKMNKSISLVTLFLGMALIFTCICILISRYDKSTRVQAIDRV